jgi:hypothetical protein
MKDDVLRDDFPAKHQGLASREGLSGTTPIIRKNPVEDLYPGQGSRKY